MSLSIVLIMACARAQSVNSHSTELYANGTTLSNYWTPSVADSALIDDALVKSHRRIQHQVLAGAKVGLLFAFGLEFNYILSSKKTNILYIAASAQSSIIWNTVNVGGGFFIGNTGFGVGCRYNHMLWFELEDNEEISPGYAPEIVWYKKVGFNRNMYVNLHAGAIVTKSRVFPDVTIGFMLPLK